MGPSREFRVPLRGPLKEALGDPLRGGLGFL